MNFTELAFSFEGRINRVVFWKTLVPLGLIAWIGIILAEASEGLAALVGWVILTALIWPLVAVVAKRWHDRDKSALWCLLLLVPIAGHLWSLVELGFFQGTSGPNRFGYPIDVPKENRPQASYTRPRKTGHASRPRSSKRILPPSYPDLMAMFAKLAKCDGPISRAEISVLDSYMAGPLALSTQARKEAIDEFRDAKDSGMSFEAHARRFHRFHSDETHFLSEIIDALVTLAMADGKLKRREVLFLDLVVAIFGVSSRKYYESKYGEPGPRVDSTSLPEEKEYARTLGLTGRVSKDEIRKAYRGLVGQYHPDKVSHLGPRLREVADNEIKKINEAYEFFRKKYDL